MPPEPSFSSVVRRAHLLRVLVVYVSAGFGVLQAVDVLENRLGLPTWFFPGALVLLLLGIPIILATALVQAAHGHGWLVPDVAPVPEATTSPAGAPAAPPGFAGAAASSSVTTSPGRPPAAAVPPLRATHARLLTWRNALLGGSAAFALLGFGTAAYMGMRAFGIGPVGTLLGKGVLKERDRVVIADVVDETSDPRLGAVVTEALRAQLEQSPSISVVPARELRATLLRMRADTAGVLTGALAQEAAQRIGAKAVLLGKVGAAGSGYVLSADLLAPDSSAALVTVVETARDGTEMIPALDRLSDRLRERIGESLKSIRESPPLEQVSTSSLEALRVYSEAAQVVDRSTDWERGVPLLRSAVTIDTGFAAAYAKLGIALLNENQRRTEALAMLARALAHADRLPPLERYRTLAAWAHEHGDYGRTEAYYRAMLQLDPNNTTALNNLGLLYTEQGQFARSDSFYLRAMAVAPDYLLFRGNHVGALMRMGRFDSARAVLAREAQPLRGTARGQALVIAAMTATADSLPAVVAGARAEGTRGLSGAIARILLSSALRAQGRLAEADAADEQTAETAAGQGLESVALEHALGVARARALLRGDAAGAARVAADALRRFPLAAIGLADRPYLLLAYTLALAGKPDQAQGALDEYMRARQAGQVEPEPSTEHLARGAIALARNRSTAAIPELRAAYESPMPTAMRLRGCWSCAMALLGRAFDAAGQPDSAIAAYTRFLDQPEWGRLFSLGEFVAPTHERLVELYLARGDRAAAARHGASFLQLWNGADPALQPRVTMMRRRLGAAAGDARAH